MPRDYSALHRFIAERTAMPFEWGHDKNDCVSFAGAAIAAQTGANPIGERKWTSEDEASAALNEAESLGEAVTGLLTEIEPAFAQRGDVGAIEHGNNLILVIVEGDTLVGPGPRGLRRLPRRMMVKAWSVE
jgi:hypothetical protein